MELRDRVVLVLTSMAVLAGTVGGLTISAAVGLYTLCGLLLAVVTVIVFEPDEPKEPKEPTE